MSYTDKSTLLLQPGAQGILFLGVSKRVRQPPTPPKRWRCAYVNVERTTAHCLSQLLLQPFSPIPGIPNARQIYG
jgi:hypothetical protein